MALTDKLSAIGDAIREKTGKEELIKLDDMPQEIASISGIDYLAEKIQGTLTIYENKEVTRIVDSAFYGTHCIKRIICPNVKTIETYGVRACANLEYFDFSSVEKAHPVSFAFCGIKSVYAPKLNWMGNQIFLGCSKLETVDFTQPLDLGGWAFPDCISLKTIILRAESLCNLTGLFNNNIPIASGTGYIYVPKALIEEYKVATNWVTYANQFRAIEDYPEICGGAE